MLYIYNSFFRLELDFVFFSSRVDRCTLSPLVCLSFSLIFFYGCGLPSLRIPVLDTAVCDGVVEGLEWYWGFDGAWGAPVALTLINLAQSRLPNVGAERLSCALAPWNPGCTDVWPAPKWWQSYS